MAYTVGIRRRFLPWYQKFVVTGHDWHPDRLILNLADASQVHFRGVTVLGLKVYADFWTHLAQERARTAPAAPLITRSAPVQEDVPRETEPPPGTRFVSPEQYLDREPEPDPQMQEVRRRAAERVRSILASDGAH